MATVVFYLLHTSEIYLWEHFPKEMICGPGHARGFKEIIYFDKDYLILIKIPKFFLFI